LFFFFFFSSRRRHTRFSRDWSSDVCSSDLTPLVVGAEHRSSLPPDTQIQQVAVTEVVDHPAEISQECPFARIASHEDTASIKVRSEERRVGKVCRSPLSQ